MTKSAARAGSEAAAPLLNIEEKEVPAAAVAIRLVLDDDDDFAVRVMLDKEREDKEVKEVKEEEDKTLLLL